MSRHPCTVAFQRASDAALADALRRRQNQANAAKATAQVAATVAAVAVVPAPAEPAKPRRSWKRILGDAVLCAVLCMGLAASAKYITGTIHDMALMQAVKGRNVENLTYYSGFMHGFGTPLQIGHEIAEIHSYQKCALLAEETNRKLQNLNGCANQDDTIVKNIHGEYEKGKDGVDCVASLDRMEDAINALEQQHVAYAYYFASREGFLVAASLLSLHFLLHFCSWQGVVAFFVFLAWLAAVHVVKKCTGSTLVTYLFTEDPIRSAWGWLIDFEKTNPGLSVLMAIQKGYVQMHSWLLEFLPYHLAYAGELTAFGSGTYVVLKWRFFVTLVWGMLSGPWILVWWQCRYALHRELCNRAYESSGDSHDNQSMDFLFLSVRYCASLLLSWIPYRFIRLMGGMSGRKKRQARGAQRHVRLPWLTNKQQKQTIMLDLGASDDESEEEEEDSDDGYWHIVLQWYRHRNVAAAAAQLVLHFAFCMYMHRAENLLLNSAAMPWQKVFQVATSVPQDSGAASE